MRINFFNFGIFSIPFTRMTLPSSSRRFLAVLFISLVLWIFEAMSLYLWISTFATNLRLVLWLFEAMPLYLWINTFATDLSLVLWLFEVMPLYLWVSTFATNLKRPNMKPF